jgi:diacylglycerol O-acyltransferase / wax synthase
MYSDIVAPRPVRKVVPGLSAEESALAKPYAAPRSILNGSITAHRRIATQSYEMTRIRALGEKAGGTVNDVILAICAGGLRRYLSEFDALPERALVAGMPMSFHLKDSDEAGGNATTMALASLATDVADPKERFAAIVASTTKAKEHMGSMPRAAIMNYTALLAAPFAATLVTGMSSRVKPMFNLVISNVPGVREPLYLNGAALEEWYPLSIPVTGLALNITVLSYVDRMNFCFTACGAMLPHVQRMAPYCGEAFAELDKAFA